MKIPKIARQLQFMWIALNERWLNISTADRTQYIEPPGWWRGEKTDKARHQDNCSYGTPDYYYVRKMARRLAPGEQDVLYDIGSGKGRILCVFARRRVKKCVGIELIEELCQISRANAERLRGRRCPIEVRCEDAALADLSDGTVYFLINPFGRETLNDVLMNIERSLKKNPRRVRVVYYNSVHRDLLEKCGWLRRVNEFSTANALKVDFYDSAGMVESRV